jgi:YD repeat-containing protein
MSKLLLVVAGLGVFLFIVCMPASAQVGNNCVGKVVSAATGLFGEPFEPPLPPTAKNCMPLWFEFATECQVQNDLCAPSYAASAICPCENAAGQPISLANGDTWIEENDIRLPGLGGGLVLTRTWNSTWPEALASLQIGIFGPGWRSSYEESVVQTSDGYITYLRGDGSDWFFGYSGYNSQMNVSTYKLVAPANVSAVLLIPATLNSPWMIVFQNGEKRTFDPHTGRLTSIEDLHSNTTSVSYDSSGRLIAVTDAAARHLYYSYGASTFLVSSVTSDFGESVSYSYDSQGRLSQVTEPDGSTLSFQYDGNSFISAVLDSNGKVLEAHTYDSSGRGLSSTRANGVDSLTITYR